VAKASDFAINFCTDDKDIKTHSKLVSAVKNAAALEFSASRTARSKVLLKITHQLRVHKFLFNNFGVKMWRWIKKPSISSSSA
jgi:hypothetical protein